MHHKYLYLFLNDVKFRLVFILSIVGIILCIVLFRLSSFERTHFKDIRDKRALIDQIPEMLLEIERMKGMVGGLFLNGIVTGKAQPMAVINNVLVKAGDTMGSKTVVSIGDRQVTVCVTEKPDKCQDLILQE